MFSANDRQQMRANGLQKHMPISGNKPAVPSKCSQACSLLAWNWLGLQYYHRRQNKVLDAKVHINIRRKQFCCATIIYYSKIECLAVCARMVLHNFTILRIVVEYYPMQSINFVQKCGKKLFPLGNFSVASKAQRLFLYYSRDGASVSTFIRMHRGPRF